MNNEAKIKQLIEEKRELQAAYRHAAHRSRDIRTRVIHPNNEPARREILARYAGEKVSLNKQINDLGDEIWRLQHEGND